MKKTMKKMFALMMTALMSVGVFAGCRDKKTGEVDPDGKIAISVKISDALAEGELMFNSLTLLVAFTLVGKIAPININIYIIEKPFLILSPKI